MEVIQRILTAALVVAHKAGDVINTQFGVVDQYQAAGSGLAKELVAETAFDTGDDFPFQKCVSKKLWKVDKPPPESSQSH